MGEHEIGKYATVIVCNRMARVTLITWDQVGWVRAALTPDQARAIAADLIAHADKLQQQTGSGAPAPVEAPLPGEDE